MKVAILSLRVEIVTFAIKGSHKKRTFYSQADSKGGGSASLALTVLANVKILKQFFLWNMTL